MAQLEDAVVKRAIAWCAEAGRQTGEVEVRAVLEALSWEQLLAAKALLADPPPARPLGPHALADIARGAHPDIAAERERQGRYLPDPDRAPLPPEAAGRAKKRKPAGLAIRVRKQVSLVPSAPEPPARKPLLAELYRAEGRTELERLLRRLGANRTSILAALAARFRSEDGTSLSDADLEAVLVHHGLARGFARRERDLVLHAVRAAGGVLARAAAALGVPDLAGAIARLGLGAEVEAIRAEKRAALLARATLGNRARRLLADEPALADLGILADVERDLRARLPEHLKALRASGGGDLGGSLARSLSLTYPEAMALSERFGLGIPRSPAPRPRPGGRERRVPGGRGARPGRPPTSALKRRPPPS